jgi:hypothetical protein
MCRLHLWLIFGAKEMNCCDKAALDKDVVPYMSKGTSVGYSPPTSELLLDVLAPVKCAVKQPCLRDYLPNGRK